MTKTTALIALAGAATFAAADVIATYSYTDLDGAFDGSTFTADGASNNDLASTGDVSLLVGSKGTAEFTTGFAGLAPADVAITMDISNVTATTATGVGSVILTDTDGDTISAAFSGEWNIINPFGFMFFSGSSSDYAFTDNGQLDGRFNGTLGSFAISNLLNQFYDGAISLLLQTPGGFATVFDGVSTQADGLLVPTPGVLAIAGVGLAGMARRRRD